MNIKAIERIFFMENNFFKSHPTFPYKEYKMKFSKIQFSLCFEREREKHVNPSTDKGVIRDPN